MLVTEAVGVSGLENEGYAADQRESLQFGVQRTLPHVSDCE